jgi:hypothetical protein
MSFSDIACWLAVSGSLEGGPLRAVKAFPVKQTLHVIQHKLALWGAAMAVVVLSAYSTQTTMEKRERGNRRGSGAPCELADLLAMAQAQV